MKRIAILALAVIAIANLSFASVRTVVFMEKETTPGQDIFIKGGHDAGLVPGVYPSMSEPITYNNTLNQTTAAIKANDASLDWGTESALDWTCDTWPSDWGTKRTYAADGYGEDPENTMGIHQWKFDVMMDGVAGEWYEFKAFMREGSTEWWESDRSQANTPYSTINHWGKKGYLTKCQYNGNWVEFIQLGTTPNQDPTADFAVSPSTAYTDDDFSVDASTSSDPEDGANIEVRWDWNNDGIYDTAYSTTKTATHSYATTGGKTIKLEVKDSEGAIDTKTLTVTVEERPNQILTIHYRNSDGWSNPNMHWGYNHYVNVADLPSSGNDGFGVFFVIDWTDSATYLTTCFNDGGSSWDGTDRVINKPTSLPDEIWILNGDATIYDSNPIDSTPPTVSLTAPANGANLSGTITVSANASDNVGVTKVGFYYGSTLIAEDESSPFAVSWNTAYASDGSHTITAVAYDAGGNSTTSSGRTVSLNNPNLSPVANAGSDVSGIVNMSVQLNGSASYDPNGSIVSYSWTGDITSSSANPTHTFTSEGDYTATLTVTDDEGATDSDTVNIHIGTTMARGDFREESIYFVMTARFNDGDIGNNRPSRCYETSGNAANNDPGWRGDFKGLIEKLDYIKALGFTAVWITPVVLNRSDYDFHGYHAWDFNKVDPRLESTGASYQELIDAAHSKGMKVIQDIVLNHSCRYGAKDIHTVRYWGDSDDPEWGEGTAIDYYDVENPSFEYNGLDYEPISGKNWYNGDLWQKDKPNLPWSDLPGWGEPTQWCSPEGYRIYNYQWPHMDLFPNDLYHEDFLKNWEDYTCQLGSIHEDCIDLNTENTTVQNFLIDAYNRYIDMGVDAFRIDTVKHVSRLTFNRRFIPAFKQRGGENFFMFGEVCTRVHEVWNHGNASLSTPFYTWAERHDYNADDFIAAEEAYNWENLQGPGGQPTSGNHYLNGNDYHEPDYSRASGMAVIDFPMHWNFSSAGSAYGVARGSDHYYNDATWNVMYVDSHDYGPGTDNRYSGSEGGFAESWSMMWTFRGIPCVYYGSEIQFQKGARADVGPTGPLSSTGRAYFGGHIVGSVNTTDFGVWNNAQGEMANTLNHPLAKHLARLNRIRRAVPALQKGQYSATDVSGWMAYKRRYTKNGVDSFALITVSGGATFNNIPNGTYIDCVTGDVQNVSDGTLNANCGGQGNLRVYVLDLPGNPAPGKIGNDTEYLH